MWLRPPRLPLRTQKFSTTRALCLLTVACGRRRCACSALPSSRIIAPIPTCNSTPCCARSARRRASTSFLRLAASAKTASSRPPATIAAAMGRKTRSCAHELRPSQLRRALRRRVVQPGRRQRRRILCVRWLLTINGGPPSVGRAAIAEAAQSFMTGFPDLHVSLDGVFVEGERSIFRWTLDGRNTGPGGTGAHVHISGHEEWRIGDDGLITDSLGHFDAADYQRQLGQEVSRPR